MPLNGDLSHCSNYTASHRCVCVCVGGLTCDGPLLTTKSVALMVMMVAPARLMVPRQV